MTATCGCTGLIRPRGVENNRKWMQNRGNCTTESMLIFDPKKETFITFRMPYPMPFYTRGLDGRIDEAKAGWKGRGCG